MTKNQLINTVAETTGETLKTTEKIINQTLATIQSKLAAGESVEFVGFGKFGIKDVAERNGRNPRTGEDIVIAAHKFPYFKAGKVLKDAVNSNGI